MTRAIALARELSLPYELCEALELRAELLTAPWNDYADALTACVEARELAERIEEAEVVDRMRVLELRLRAAAGELTVDAACAALGALLDAAPDDTARAPILLAIWQIDPQRTDARTAAAETLSPALCRRPQRRAATALSYVDERGFAAAATIAGAAGIADRHAWAARRSAGARRRRMSVLQFK